MTDIITRQLSSLQKISTLIAAARGSGNAMLRADKEFGPYAKADGNLSEADTAELAQEVADLLESLPGCALPLVVSADAALTEVRLAGVRIDNIGIEESLADFAILETALQNISAGDAQQYLFGPEGRLLPQAADQMIIARSPAEAALKYAMTKIGFTEIQSLDPACAAIDAERTEMRTQSDWKKLDTLAHLEEGCIHLNEVLASRDASPEPSL